MPQDPSAPQQSSYTKKCPTCFGSGWRWDSSSFISGLELPCDVCLGNGTILVLVTPAPSGREVLADAGTFEPRPVLPAVVHEPSPDVQTSPRILGDEFGSPVGGYSWGGK